MESALSPREIQARIRAGESVADVAEVAGVPADQIEVYAGPVLAEREHAALLARGAQVRRRGEASTQRLLGDVVTDVLAVRGVEPELISWDAWRGEDRRWTVRVSWSTDDGDQHADFDFDQRSRFSTAADETARSLIDERPPATERPGDPDAEPTIDLNDELAIVRVVQEDSEPPAVRPDVPAARIIKLPGAPKPGKDASEPDDYTPAELAQVDGVYEILPPPSDMDVLYEMLAGFNEDSVRIYTGLTQPVSTQTSDEPRPATPPAAEPRQQQTEPEPVPETEAEPEPTPAPTAEPAITEPEQDALVDEPAPQLTSKPAKKRKRASVPTWDEIMFGGPHTPKP